MLVVVVFEVGGLVCLTELLVECEIEEVGLEVELELVLGEVELC